MRLKAHGNEMMLQAECKYCCDVGELSEPNAALHGAIPTLPVFAGQVHELASSGCCRLQGLESTSICRESVVEGQDLSCLAVGLPATFPVPCLVPSGGNKH
jgi:hypothetical protein